MEKRLIEAYDRMTMPDDCSRRIERKLERKLRQTRGGAWEAQVQKAPQQNWWSIAAAAVCLVLMLSVGSTVLLRNVSENISANGPETLGTDPTQQVQEETQETEEDYYRVATSLPASEVERFASDVRNDILLRDWESLSQKIAYPITINKTAIPDKETFLELDMDGLLNSEFLKAIEEESCRRMFCNWQGISMGNAGQIWIAQILTGSGEGELKIIAINDMLRPVSEEDAQKQVQGEENAVTAATVKFIGILRENGRFYSNDYGTDLSIREYCERFGADSEIELEVPKFAVVDMDGDGAKEIVLWLRVHGTEGASDYGTMVLRYQDGTVYGDTFSYRQLSELKVDGTFHWSGSASYNGTGVLKFTDTECTVERTLYVESSLDEVSGYDAAHYYHNGAEITEVDYDALSTQQGFKEDALWHVYPCQQVHGLLESYAYADMKKESAANVTYYYALFQDLAGGHIGRAKSSWDALCTHLTEEGDYVWSISEEGCLIVYFPDVPGSWFYAYPAGENAIGEIGYYLCTEDGEYEVRGIFLETDSPQYYINVDWKGEGTPVSSVAEVSDYINRIGAKPNGLELEQLAVTTAYEQFSSAYFTGDAEGMRCFLADDFTGKVEIYSGSQDYFINREIGRPEEVMQVGDTLTAWIEFKESPSSDSYTYLTMELIKQEDGWKVLFYGLEK